MNWGNSVVRNMRKETKGLYLNERKGGAEAFRGPPLAVVGRHLSEGPPQLQ